jgi:hypothetical protein
VDDGVPTHAVLSGQPACAQGGKECSCGAWAWRLRPRGHEVGDGAGTGLARSSVRAAFVRKGRPGGWPATGPLGGVRPRINADAKVNVGVNAGSSDPRRGSVVRGGGWPAHAGGGSEGHPATAIRGRDPR